MWKVANSSENKTVKFSLQYRPSLTKYRTISSLLFNNRKFGLSFSRDFMVPASKYRLQTKILSIFFACSIIQLMYFTKPVSYFLHDASWAPVKLHKSIMKLALLFSAFLHFSKPKYAETVRPTSISVLVLS